MCGKHHNETNLCFLILLILLLQCCGCGDNAVPMNLISEFLGVGGANEEENAIIEGNRGNGCCRCKCGCGF